MVVVLPHYNHNTVLAKIILLTLSHSKIKAERIPHFLDVFAGVLAVRSDQLYTEDNR